MAATNSAATDLAERELVVTPLIEAPRELVFKAWTEPEHLMHWWGPKGFTTPFCRIDFRPGGVFHYCAYDRPRRDKTIGASVSIAKSWRRSESSTPMPLRMRRAIRFRQNTTE